MAAFFSASRRWLSLLYLVAWSCYVDRVCCIVTLWAVKQMVRMHSSSWHELFGDRRLRFAVALVVVAPMLLVVAEDDELAAAGELVVAQAAAEEAGDRRM